MKIVEFAVRRPVTVTILVGVLLILGYVSFSRLAVDLYPDMKLPVAAVITSYPGAGPEEVESQLSRPIESILGTISDIKEIQSRSLAGSSLVIVRFNWGTDMDFATLNMREKLAIIEKYLPDEADKPMVVKMDPSMMPVIQIGMTGGEDLGKLQQLAEDKVKPALERLPGVASVVLTGGLTREVRVEVDPSRLENYNLTLSQVVMALRADNFNQAAGLVKEGERQYFVRCLQQFEDVEDIKNLTIVTSTGAMVRLEDIADIKDGYKDTEQMTRMNTKPSMGIHVLKQSDANSVEVSRRVKEELKSLSQEIPGGIEIGVAFDQADFINQSMVSIGRSMLEGSLLAMLILYLFLRSVPSTLVIATSIPLSIVATFVLMYFNNMTMNMVTMGGIALGIGRMVDDSIVVLESIFRHRLKGASPVEAAVTGASEVGKAVMAATFTTVAVFFPIVFVEGIAAIIFKPMAITVGFAILSSLAVALTIIPLLSSRMLTGQIVHEIKGDKGIAKLASRFTGFLDGLGEWYRGVIWWALGHRRLVVIIVVVLMVASLGLVPLIGAEFLPKTDAGQIGINVEMDKGTVLARTDEVVREIEDVVMKIPEVEVVFTSVGPSGNMMIDTGAAQSDTATIKVMLCKKTERQRSTTQITEEIRKKLADLPGVKISVVEVDPSTQGMQSSDPVSINIKGDDLDELKRISEEVAGIVRRVPGTREVKASLNEGKPEVRLKVDRAKAAFYGLTPYQVAQVVEAAVQGTVATRYRSQGDEVDVRVRYPEWARKDLEDLGSITIITPSGAKVTLDQLATFEAGRGPMSITRIDQVRTAQVTSQLAGRDVKSVTDDIKKGLSSLNLPPGYTIEFGGADKEMVESFTSLTMALLLAVVLVYAVMAIQYESFFIPFVVMFSVPTCFIGVAAGLALTGRPFSVPAYIGVIMLVGIAVSNCIVLVDYIGTLRGRGMARNEAVAEAGAVRLRPVLMTALATILALLPLAFGFGEGGETEAPLATVVIGGLLTSTAVTLVLVPVVYTIFDDLGQRIGGRFRKKEGPEVLEA